MNRQKGFSVVEGLLIVAVVLLLGFIGYTVYNRQKDTKRTNTPPPAAASDIPSISDKSSLSEAVDQLKTVDTDTEKDEEALRDLVE